MRDTSRWWPVGWSVLAFLGLALLPAVGAYWLITASEVPMFVVFFATVFALGALLTVVELIAGKRMAGKVINHADIASAFFGIFLTGAIGNGLVIVLLAPVAGQLAGVTGISLWPADLPILLQIALGLVIADLVMYPLHRYMHSHDSLWRVHVVHHSVSELRPVRTWLQHPIEVVLLGVVPAIPLVLLDAPAVVATLVGTIRVTVGLVDHSTLPLRTGWLDYVIHTPNDHWWHHNLTDKGGANFTTVVIPIDILFGTFKKPPVADPVPERIGIPEPQISGNRYIEQLGVPFRWRSLDHSE